MTRVSIETTYFVNQLDTAVEAHMDWVRRVLRCAVLRTSPCDEVLDPLAHTLCRFGRWFALSKPNFETIDAQKAQKLGAVHQRMHDAIRAIGTDLLAGRGGQSCDLDIFDETQSELIKLLAEFKTQVLAFPSEPLPWALKWSDQLSVNVPEIDTEHRQFIQLCDEFNEAIVHRKSLDEIQSCVQAILDDAGAHFYHEESLLKNWGYPETDEHAQKHQQILSELSRITGILQERVESEWIETGLQVKRILIEHVLIEDMKYHDFRKENSLR